VLTFYFLGLPRLERDGRPVEVDTRKAIALLAYLALMGNQSRDALAALLWPEYDQSHALAEGESGRALQLAQEALALCVAQGDRHREAALRSNLADMLHAAGRSEEAMAHLKQSVAIYAEIGGEAGAWQPEIWKLTEW
jgi:hypothetical protein